MRPRVLAVGLLGFASGLPLYLTGQTLTAWMTAAHVDLSAIGAFSLVGLPYTLKWMWAPLLDRYALPLLDRRRGWIAALQLALVGAIALMGGLSPRAAPVALAVAAVAVAFLSASLDVVIDAYKADVLAPDEQMAGAAAAVTGYRVAMVLGGTVALALASHVSWRAIYGLLAAVMAATIVVTWRAPRTPAPTAPARTLAEALWRPIAELVGRPRAGVVLAFVALYKLGDHLAQAVMIPFLKDGAGFSFGEIAALYHLVGLGGTIVGGVVAARVGPRWSRGRALVVFGALQALANLGYLALVGSPSLGVLALAVTVDNLANALGTAAFVSYLMAECDPAVSATQLALLTSLSSLGGRVFGFAAGSLAARAGWPVLWLATAATALPALLLVRALPPTRPR